jgi:hypothetical protein
MYLEELISQGIPAEIAAEQLRLLARGTLHASIVRSAAIADGVRLLSSDEVDEAVKLYNQKESGVKVLKFVPASGAATRMFKDLSVYQHTQQITPLVTEFFSRVSDFAFASSLPHEASQAEVLTALFTEVGLAQMPKGSVPFHKYPQGSRTAFEEHLVEGVSYAASGDKVHIHFTVSPSHIVSVKQAMDKWADQYSQRMGCSYDLSFSTQLASTDTVAKQSDGKPFRTADGKLFLRPGGHGSLIHNLNELDADIIFIKNVDNVVPDEHRGDTIRYKKALAGVLIAIRGEARKIISRLKAGEEDAISAAKAFLLQVGFKAAEEHDTEQLIKLMNRPYRVCGMVRNEGEPGGGPFWVDKGGVETLQIVESAEIDPDNAAHKSMLAGGTHFNPVDLVCCLNDLYGQRKNLHNHVDMDAAFVTSKLVEGQTLTVLEWPGLWNGAMSDWNSLFLEVPISTFNPVKRVNDLLRPMHQSSNS